MRTRSYFVGVVVLAIIVALLVYAWISFSFWPIIAASVVVYVAFFTHEPNRRL